MHDSYVSDEDELSLVDSADGLTSVTPRSNRSDVDGGIGSYTPSGMGVRPSTNVGSFKVFLLSAALAEFVASFFMVYIGISAIYAANLVGDDALSTGSLLLVAIGYGFTYGCLVYSFSLNGGGYVPSIRQLNPSLTFALYLLGKIDTVKAIILVLAQVTNTRTHTNTNRERVRIMRCTHSLNQSLTHFSYLCPSADLGCHLWYWHPLCLFQYSQSTRV